MKKILATLSIIFCLAFAITGLGGCSGCSSTDETGNGGQTVNTITTLEGVWESEYGKTGEHEKIIIRLATRSNKVFRLIRVQENLIIRMKNCLVVWTMLLETSAT